MARHGIDLLWPAGGILVAFWPIWMWQFSRFTDGSDEPLGLVALGTALLLSLFRPSTGVADYRTLIVPSLMIGVYIATYPHLSRLPQAVLAVTAIGAVVSRLRFGCLMHPAPWGLLVLSLPVISSLQFFLGYPLRVAAGTVAVLLLQVGGFAVVRAGAGLQWGSELVAIDAPCSGVKMLWVGLYLTFTLACLFKLSTFKTLVAAALSTVTIVLGNSVRAASLFHVEVGFVQLPSWSHDATGIMVFILTSLIILWTVHTIGKAKTCERAVCS
jgi:exosortase/archaeosortase family protein